LAFSTTSAILVTTFFGVAFAAQLIRQVRGFPFGFGILIRGFFGGVSICNSPFFISEVADFVDSSYSPSGEYG